MEVVKTMDNGIAILALSGRLDTGTAPLVEKELVATIKETPNVILDFTGVAYVSSAGLRTLLIGQKTTKAAGGVMQLRGVNEDVMEVLKMTNFSALLTILP